MSELMKLLRGGAKRAIEDNTGQRSNKTARWRQNRTKRQGGMMDQRKSRGDWQVWKQRGDKMKYN